jgi:hypothetical protein
MVASETRAYGIEIAYANEIGDTGAAAQLDEMMQHRITVLRGL